MSQPEIPLLLAKRKLRKMIPIKPQPDDRHCRIDFECGVLKESSQINGCWHVGRTWKPRYKIDDRLYVKETWWDLGWWSKDGRWIGRSEYSTVGIKYCADGEPEGEYAKHKRYSLKCLWRKRPSIFMHKWAARIWMPRVTKVTVQRPQELSLKDIIAEGWNKKADLFPNMNTEYKAQTYWKNLYISVYGLEAWEQNLLHFVTWWAEIEVKGEK